MTRLCVAAWLAAIVIVLLGGCATRPINPPVTQGRLPVYME